MKDLTDPVKCHRGGKPWKNQHPHALPTTTRKAPKDPKNQTFKPCRRARD